MKSNYPTLLRWLRRFFLVILIVLFALYIGLPVGMAVLATYPSKEAVGATPEGFIDIALETDDGVTLAGWYAPPQNGAVILLLHGAGGSREDLRLYANMLGQHGYGVLALDLRGHGASGGKTNRLGWTGTRDVGAALAYLQAQPEVRRIGGLGISMGGEVLLGAAADYPALAAIAADGATRRCLDELLTLPSERPLVRNFTARVMYAAVQVFSGEKPPKPLLHEMVAAKSTPFLLVAAGANLLEVEFNRLFAETVGERVELWVAPDVEHTAAFKRYPDEYEQRVIAFFDRTLAK